MLRWKSKKIPVRYLRCCIRSFVGRDTGKMPENFCWKESLKKDFSQKKTEDVFLTGSTGWRLYQKPRDIARSTEGKLLFRDLKPYLQIFGYFSVVDRDNWSGEMYKYRDDIPEKYDDRLVYGIGMEDNPDADTLPPKRLVIVLSENEKEES